MALFAVLVIHQCFAWNKVSIASAGKRVFEVLLSIDRGLFGPFSRVLSLGDEHRADCECCGDADSFGDRPADWLSDQSMEPIQPHRDERCQDVRPIHHAFASCSPHKFE